MIPRRAPAMGAAITLVAIAVSATLGAVASRAVTVNAQFPPCPPFCMRTAIDTGPFNPSGPSGPSYGPQLPPAMPGSQVGPSVTPTNTPTATPATPTPATTPSATATPRPTTPTPTATPQPTTPAASPPVATTPAAGAGSSQPASPRVGNAGPVTDAGPGWANWLMVIGAGLASLAGMSFFRVRSLSKKR
jgi:hypothetical protein